MVDYANNDFLKCAKCGSKNVRVKNKDFSIEEDYIELYLELRCLDCGAHTRISLINSYNPDKVNIFSN